MLWLKPVLPSGAAQALFLAREAPNPNSAWSWFADVAKWDEVEGGFVAGASIFLAHAPNGYVHEARRFDDTVFLLAREPKRCVHAPSSRVCEGRRRLGAARAEPAIQSAPSRGRSVASTASHSAKSSLSGGGSEGSY